MKSQEDILQELRTRRRQLIKEKNWLGALEVINTAVTLEPTFDRYYNQGVVLLQLQRVKEAINSFNKSLELNPNFTKGKDALKKAQQKLQNEMVNQVQNVNSSMFTADEDKQTGNISRETLDMGKTSGNENAVEIKEYKNSKIPPLPESRHLAEDIPTERREKHILEQLAAQNSDTDDVVNEKKYSNSKIPPLPEEGLRIHPIHETNVNISAQNMTSDNVQAPIMEHSNDKTLDFNAENSISPLEQTMDFKESAVYNTGIQTICEDQPVLISPNCQVNNDAMTIDDVHSQVETKKYEPESDPDAMTIDDVHSQLAGNEQIVAKKYEPESDPDAMTIDDVHSELASSLNEQQDSDIMTIDDVHAQFEKPEDKKKTHTYFSDEFINPDDRGK